MLGAITKLCDQLALCVFSLSWTSHSAPRLPSELQAGWWVWRSLQCSPRSAAAPPRSGRWLPWRPACCASGEPAFAGVAAACSMCCRVGQLGTYRAIDRTQHGRPHSSTRMRSLAQSASAPPPPCARRRPEPGAFPAAVLYCTLCSFMLGYHVHEKAILMVSVPMAVMAAAGLMPDGRRAAGDFLFLSTGEHVQSGAWAAAVCRCSCRRWWGDHFTSASLTRGAAGMCSCAAASSALPTLMQLLRSPANIALLFRPATHSGHLLAVPAAV